MNKYRTASGSNSIAKGSVCGARYLVRLDDACQTQNNEKWNAIEDVLDKLRIKPIVGVIPCNEDPSLQRGVKDDNFWMRVKDWENKGWTIGLHGYRHIYHAVKKDNLILPFHARSEFAGLDLETQSEMLKKAFAEFVRHDCIPRIWIAPSHTFDSNTLEALKLATPIRLISDGIAFNPYIEHELTFIPQQLWWPKWKPFGIWTICLHPETMEKADIVRLEAMLSQDQFRKKLITVDHALQSVRRRGIASAIYNRVFWLRWNFSQR
mgnify:CR=1 FL=1